MATQWFFRSTDAVDQADSFQKGLVTTRGAGAGVYTAATTAGGTLIQLEASGTGLAWMTPMLNAVTIAGALSVDCQMYESDMAANCQAYVKVEKVAFSGGATTLICEKGFGTELSTNTSNSDVISFTAGEVTDTVLADKDRIRITVYGANIGTMAAGHSVLFHVDGTAGNGDSSVSFTEDLTQWVPPALTLPFVEDFNRGVPSTQDTSANLSTIGNDWTEVATFFRIFDGEVVCNEAAGSTGLMQQSAGTISQQALVFVEAQVYVDATRGTLRIHPMLAGSVANLTQPVLEISGLSDSSFTVGIYMGGSLRASTAITKPTSTTKMRIGMSVEDIGGGQIRIRGYVDRVLFGTYTTSTTLSSGWLTVENVATIGLPMLDWIQALTSVPDAPQDPEAEWFIGSMSMAPLDLEPVTVAYGNNKGTLRSRQRGSFHDIAGAFEAASEGATLIVYSTTDLVAGHDTVFVSSPVTVDWDVYQSFLEFNLSAFPPGTPVESAVFDWGAGGATPATIRIEAREHDYGTSLSTADWVPGSQVGSKTLLAEAELIGWEGGSLNSSTWGQASTTDALNAAVQSHINNGTPLRVVVCSSVQNEHNPDNGVSSSIMGGDASVHVLIGSNATEGALPTVTTSGSSTTNTTGYTTASFTVTAGRSYVAVIAQRSEATTSDGNGGILFPVAPTLSDIGGASWSYVKRGSTKRVTAVSNYFLRAESTATGTVTFTFSENQSTVAWVILEIPEAIEPGAIVQRNQSASINRQRLTVGLPVVDVPSIVIGSFLATDVSSGSFTPLLGHTTITTVEVSADMELYVCARGLATPGVAAEYDSVVELAGVAVQLEVGP